MDTLFVRVQLEKQKPDLTYIGFSVDIDSTCAEARAGQTVGGRLLFWRLVLERGVGQAGSQEWKVDLKRVKQGQTGTWEEGPQPMRTDRPM